MQRFPGQEAREPEARPLVGSSGLDVGQEEVSTSPRVLEPRFRVRKGVTSPGDTQLGGTREPTVVVDPNNPMNVAYASLFQLRVSTNGGGTFQPAVGATLLPGSDNDGDGQDGEDPIEAGVDNDRDGAIDEDGVDGVDNDGDGLIDEDSGVDIDNDGDGATNEDPDFQTTNGDPSLAFDSQGRLFWTWLVGANVRFDTDGNGSLDGNTRIGLDLVIAGVSPSTGNILAGYPVNITASAGVNLPAANGNSHDKQWIAADCFAGSMFQDRLYVVWTDLTGNSVIRTTFSTDLSDARARTT